MPLIQSLIDYYDILCKNGKLAAENRMGYAKKHFDCAVDIDENGNLRDVFSIDRDLIVPCYDNAVSSQIRADFLWGNSEYVLGVCTALKEKARTDGTRNIRSDVFRQTNLTWLAEVNTTEANAIFNFLFAWSAEDFQKYFTENPDKATLYQELRKKNENVTICVNNKFIVESVEMQIIWDSIYQNSHTDSPFTYSAVSGEKTAIARLHPQIVGINPGVGCPLISANSPNFESNGCDMSQSLNCPVSIEEAYKYTTALNWLIAEKSRRLGRKYAGNDGIVTLCWNQNGDAAVDDTLEQIFSGEQKLSEDMVKQAVDVLEKGKSVHWETIDRNAPICILSLAQGLGRFSVLEYCETNFGKLLDNVQKHYQSMQIDGGREDRTLLPWQIIRSVSLNVGNSSGDAKLRQQLISAIVFDRPYPSKLLAMDLRRLTTPMGTDKINPISHDRIAILKMILIRNYKVDVPETFDSEDTRTAYLLGRLFASLCSIQAQAMPNIQKPLSDIWLSSTSRIPKSSFPIILKKTDRVYLKKIKKTRPNADYLMNSLLNKIPEFPSSLSIAEQGLFLIAYYQQREAIFEIIRNRKESISYPRKPDLFAKGG